MSFRITLSPEPEGLELRICGCVWSGIWLKGFGP